MKYLYDKTEEAFPEDYSSWVFIWGDRVQAIWTPGIWQVKAIVTFQNGTVKQAIASGTVEEQFPHIDKFKNNTVLTSHLSGTLWDMTVNYAQANQDAHAIREYGCFIHLKMDGTYYAGATIEGPVVYLDGQGAVMAYVPFTYSDNPRDPRNEDDLIVGTMHTHYPLTWAAANVERPVGASGPDNNSDLPGIGYDYISNLQAGHNVDAVKDFFIHGPQRRATTQ